MIYFHYMLWPYAMIFMTLNNAIVKHKNKLCFYSPHMDLHYTITPRLYPKQICDKMSHFPTVHSNEYTCNRCVAYYRILFHERC